MNRLFTAGFASTAVMTLFMELLPFAGFPRVDLAEIIGGNVFGSAPLGSGPWWVGMAIHVFLGAIVFPLALLFFAMAVRRLPPMLAGWLLGMALFLGGEAIAIPFTDGGFFSSEAAQPGLTVLEDFFSHSLYGLLLGWMAAPAIKAARAGAEAKQARDRLS